MEIRMRFERKLLERTDDEPDIDTIELNKIFPMEKQAALDEVIIHFSSKLHQIELKIFFSLIFLSSFLNV